ncbi:histidine kinase [Streptomyces albiflavescens]|uniref:protein-serine/threonine phosphatase n=1 Tax=Streptomyces albiflavescens TaxID=1623582 RepID=A0A918D4F7_9ACTN|nr:histidine kinase [Streptomyces albiflavescens]
MAGRVFLLQAGVVLLLVVVALVALVLQVQRDNTEGARNRSSTAARFVAHSPGLLQALDSPDPTAVLEPRVVQARKDAGVDYVTIFSPAGIRYAHSDPRQIGKHILGTIPDEPVVRLAKSPYGPAVSASIPIRRPDGSMAGVVAAGVTVKQLNNSVSQQLPVLLGGAGVVLALSAGGTALVSWRLRRQTHGLGPAEMTRMYEHHDAVLHAVREGVVITGGDGRLLLVNDEARRLLSLPPDAEGRHADELGLDAGITDVLMSHLPVTDEVHPAGGRLLAVSVRPAAPHEGGSGSVATLRDTTELQALAGRAEVAHERLALLYDAGVRIGTSLDMPRTAQELAQLAVPRFADFVTVDLTEPVLRGEEPGEPCLTLRRTAVAGIRESRLFPLGQLITYAAPTPHARALRGREAVLEADLRLAAVWQQQDLDRAARLLEDGFHSLVTVPLRARGIVLGLANFWRADRPESFGADDLTLAGELAARAAVSIDNARRYTKEHTVAATLQRSLLPSGAPEQNAVEVAHRYLPAMAGVGGDWFDVIPLPGARVALVVGDVAGHGLHAAVTMGRLRTAVHNFSALDLPPDELLGHLDELVARINQEAGWDDTATIGGTCAYAVYDPVTGDCSIASAGHPVPALAGTDGAVGFPDVPVAPPLGLGCEPFETARLRLTEGSRLVLYTDGLIDYRDRDIDDALRLLLDILATTPDAGAEETCQALAATVLPPQPSDDVALLVARTRLLGPDCVAEWSVPRDPAAVGPIRAECARRVCTWGLEDISFATELILSELITNAIRYGEEPIGVRLLYDRFLICEVSDGSSTSPHIRRAADTDEGGRGLFLVARFAQRWGTRYTARGKIIWTEQPLHTGTEGEGSGDLLLDQWDDATL